jgi:hypothetical protein
VQTLQLPQGFFIENSPWNAMEHTSKIFQQSFTEINMGIWNVYIAKSASIGEKITEIKSMTTPMKS